ncbi:hypothetical protein HK102_010101, partial [Quaeritorhiza haematococci]
RRRRGARLALEPQPEEEENEEPRGHRRDAERQRSQSDIVAGDLPGQRRDQLEQGRGVVAVRPQEVREERELDQIDDSRDVVAEQRRMAEPPQHGQHRHEDEDHRHRLRDEGACQDRAGSVALKP